MKKFSITKLEKARQNPTDFAKLLMAGTTDSGGFFRRARFVRWQDAVNEYHKTNDLSKALNYLEKSFSNYASNSANRRAYESYLMSLDSYVSELNSNGNIFLKKETLKISLNAISMITGRVPLTFMNNKGGFSLYFFSKTSVGWETELRFPIIQNHFAKEVYGTDLNKIEVGVFSIQDNKFHQQTYSNADISISIEELANIGKAILEV